MAKKKSKAVDADEQTPEQVQARSDKKALLKELR